jgi:serine/threonine-protein kinase 24/25/MST4
MDKTQFSKLEVFNALSKYYREIDCVGLVGKGGYGKVYIGIHPQTKEEFAVKQQDREKSENSQLERDLHVRTDGFFLVKALYAVRTVKHEFLVFEKFVGDLHVLKPGNSLVTSFVCHQVGLALEYLHSLGFLHRDLKPANVLLTRDYRAKLADFGFSCVKENSPEDPVGTEGYMAPETVTHGVVSTKSDWYSFGLIIYCLETGLHYYGNTFAFEDKDYQLSHTEERFSEVTNAHMRAWIKGFSDPRDPAITRKSYFESRALWLGVILEANRMTFQQFICEQG